MVKRSVQFTKACVFVVPLQKNENKELHDSKRKNNHRDSINSSLKFYHHPNNTVFYTGVQFANLCRETKGREVRSEYDSQLHEPVSGEPRANSMNRLFPYEARTFCIFNECVARVQTVLALSSFRAEPRCVFSIVSLFETRSGIIDDRSTLVPTFLVFLISFSFYRSLLLSLLLV